MWNFQGPVGIQDGQVVDRGLRANIEVAIRPDGVFHQFTYGPTPPLPDDIRREMNLAVTPGPRIWRNLPPARVYTYRRAL